MTDPCPTAGPDPARSPANSGTPARARGAWNLFYHDSVVDVLVFMTFAPVLLIIQRSYGNVESN